MHFQLKTVQTPLMLIILMSTWLYILHYLVTCFSSGSKLVNTTCNTCNIVNALVSVFLSSCLWNIKSIPAHPIIIIMIQDCSITMRREALSIGKTSGSVTIEYSPHLQNSFSNKSKICWYLLHTVITACHNFWLYLFF